MELTKKNIEEMIKTARGRWKTENKGFNNQKNGIYDIEHLNSRNSSAMKNHYLLTQIADIIMQIYLAWNPVRKEIKESIKNTSSKLLESFRQLTITDEDVLETARYTPYILNNRFIIAKVAIEGKNKKNQISTKIYVRNYYVIECG